MASKLRVWPSARPQPLRATAQPRILAANRQKIAPARPNRCQRTALLCVGVARGLQIPAYAQRTVGFNCRPGVREPGTATLSPGTPPSGMKAPTRHRGLRPTRANMSRRPGNRSQHPLCDGGEGESSQAADPRAKNPGLAGTSRAVPVPPRAHRGSIQSVGGGRGEHHSAALHYGQIACAAPGDPSQHSRHASEGGQRKVGVPFRSNGGWSGGRKRGRARGIAKKVVHEAIRADPKGEKKQNRGQIRTFWRAERGTETKNILFVSALWIAS
jgi:hypothetical protein